MNNDEDQDMDEEEESVPVPMITPLSPPNPVIANKYSVYQGLTTADPEIIIVIKLIGTQNLAMGLQGLTQFLDLMNSPTTVQTFTDFEEDFVNAIVSLLRYLQTLDPVSDPTVARIYRYLFTSIDTFCQKPLLFKRIPVASLKQLINQLIILLVEEKLEKCGDVYVKAIHLNCVQIIEQSDHTAILCALVKLMTECITNDNCPERQVDLVMKCLWKVMKLMPTWGENVDYESVLLEGHQFLVKFPSKWWTKRPVDTPLRTIKTIVHSTVKIKGANSMQFLSKIPNPAESEMESYILRLLKETTATERENAAKKIQRWYKRQKLSKYCFMFPGLYKAVVTIQRFSRGFLVRKKYSSLLTPEAIEARRLLQVQTTAAVKIQATWRGYSVRRSNIPVIVAIRKMRLENISESRSSVRGRHTLAQRCEMAMLSMTSENPSLLMVIRTLEDLDFITRHCRDSCIRLSQILPNQLYIIITSAARSLPDMSACNMAAFILINFCKYPPTRKNSWHPEYIDAVINVLLNWCDKEAPLFSTLCTLLWLFCQEKEWKEVILSFSKIRQRFLKIQSLVHRKQNMVSKSKQVCSASVFGPVMNMKLPTRNANWGLDYNRPNTFTNAVFALGSLMNILDIM